MHKQMQEKDPDEDPQMIYAAFTIHKEGIKSQMLLYSKLAEESRIH